MTPQELALLTNPPKRHAHSVAPDAAAKIRQLAADGLSKTVLAQRFHTSPKTIWFIVNRLGAWAD